MKFTLFIVLVFISGCSNLNYKIAYVSEKDNQYDIFIYNLKSKKIRIVSKKKKRKSLKVLKLILR